MKRVLDGSSMKVLSGENGNGVHKHKDVDIVLMDIMLRTMDGYASLTLIREIPDVEELPISAVAAKGLKGNREKCSADGASDYPPKPLTPSKAARFGACGCTGKRERNE